MRGADVLQCIRRAAVSGQRSVRRLEKLRTLWMSISRRKIDVGTRFKRYSSWYLVCNVFMQSAYAFVTIHVIYRIQRCLRKCWNFLPCREVRFRDLFEKFAQSFLCNPLFLANNTHVILRRRSILCNHYAIILFLTDVWLRMFDRELIVNIGLELQFDCYSMLDRY